MKTLKWSLLIVLVIGMGISTILLRTRSLDTPLAETDANEPSPAVEREAVADQLAPLTTVPAREPAMPLSPPPFKADVSMVDLPSESAAAVRVRADDLLATVNDQLILLKHLVPLAPSEQERAMTLEEYESRVNRAIEMELTFQAAAAQGVELTAAQSKCVDSIAQKHEATFQEYRKQGITWSSMTTAQLEFEQRLTSALMLQQNLVAIITGVAPSLDPGVQARYEQSHTEVLSRLKAQANISVVSAKL